MKRSDVPYYAAAAIIVGAVLIGLVALVVNLVVGNLLGVAGSVVFLAVIAFMCWYAGRPRPLDPR